MSSPNGVFPSQELAGSSLSAQGHLSGHSILGQNEESNGKQRGSFWGRYTVLISHVLQGSHV